MESLKKTVVLLSGGLDSSTCLYMAKSEGFEPYCLIFDYGQRHVREIISAITIAQKLGAKWEKVKISLPWKGSSLLDSQADLPRSHVTEDIGKSIPSTYVAGRNIIFLSFAVSYAEVIGAGDIFIGANSIDYSGYPDCRDEFFQAFAKAVDLGTKPTENPISIQTPLINMSKADVIKKAYDLKVPLEETWSCYKGEARPCRVCDSCRLREKGFKEAGIEDPMAVAMRRT